MSLTDFHSHILPSLDDGSRSVEESITMLRIAGEQGIKRIVATPHFYPRHDDPDRFLKARELAAQRLWRETGCDCGLPEIVLGAEVYYFRGMSESDQLERLTIGGKTCILIEMPLGPWTSEMYRELEDISLRRGLTPIVAHIDRYIRPFHTRGIPQALRDLPVLVQANASFFTDRSTQGMALRLLRSDQIHLLGSDCHNLTTRKPDLGPALRLIEQKLGTGVLQRINEYERELLDA
jgi:protein-tyrosine phosphatase